ncbi:Sir2 family NAD-dependent protein deacetylase [Diaphorobacter sp.]|uniref:Sir2 family NAD-dependent protein deacetylase n=1 Tax=Diaphorobacter sp. TaxID=1934310 RepID=UPI003D0F3948
MTQPTPPAGRSDPLYLHARQLVLFHGDARIARLQRALRIGHQHATALRDALCGDILEYHAHDASWHIAKGMDMTHDPLVDHKLAQAAEWIGNATCMVVAAGAGMGIDSGLPDFRGDNGFWRAYPALGRQGLRFESIASPQAFEKHPATAWGFYGHRLNLYRATTPHAGFGLLRRWGQRMPQGCFVFTSNVDGHFQKAGYPTARIYECHGSIHRLQCTANCSGEIWPTADLHPQVDEAACLLQSAPPRCPKCGALARPNILMFDDWQWNDARSQQQRMLLDMWLDSAQAPVVIEIGAGRAVATVRRFSQRMQQRGSPLIRINLHEANIHNPHAIEISLGAKEALERIDQHLTGAGNPGQDKSQAD